MGENKQFLGHIAAFVTILVWGFGFVSVVVLLRSFTPAEILFFRFGLAMIALYIIYPKRMAKTTWRQELLFLAAGVSGVTMYFLLQDFALLHTAASNVSVIVAVSPVFTILLSWWLLKSGRPKGTFFLGALLALGGIGLISFGSSQLEVHPLGDFLAVLGALSWAIYCVVLKKISELGHHTIQVTRRVFFYGLIFLIPVILASDFRLGLYRFLEWQNIGGIIYLGIASSALCFVFWNFSLKRLGPVKTSVYAYLIPLVAVGASIALLDEVITWSSGAGIALVLVGVLLSNRKEKKRKVS